MEEFSCGAVSQGSIVVTAAAWVTAMAPAPTGPLAWEPPYATGLAQRNSKKTDKKKKRKV